MKDELERRIDIQRMIEMSQECERMADELWKLAKAYPEELERRNGKGIESLSTGAIICSSYAAMRCESRRFVQIANRILADMAEDNGGQSCLH